MGISYYLACLETRQYVWVGRLDPQGEVPAVDVEGSIAMFALGLTTRWQSVREAGLKPLALAGMLALWLLLGGAALSYGAYWLFH